MSLTIQRSWFVPDRLDVVFRFTCDACGATCEQAALLDLSGAPGKSALLVPGPPASWRAVNGRHYCAAHALRVQVSAQGGVLPLEG